MKVCDYLTKNNIMLAPMAGITDYAFRLICKEQGCGTVFSEMVSAKGLFYNDKKTRGLLLNHERVRPFGVQIFGSDPEIMSKASSRLCENELIDFIDINMGCPTPKIVKNGDGAALMTYPLLAEKIISSVVNACSKPVTVKIRKGWDDTSVNAAEIACIAEKSGACAVTVHGRTRMEFYSGTADWNIIKEVKHSVSIPVIGNGDVFTPEDANKMIELTNCDGVMIGRGARGNPWIFRRTSHYLSTGELLPEPSVYERIDKIMEHLDLLVQYKGEKLAVREIRKHIAWYIKGLRNSSYIKYKSNRADRVKDIKNLMSEYSKEFYT